MTQRAGRYGKLQWYIYPSTGSDRGPGWCASSPPPFRVLPFFLRALSHPLQLLSVKKVELNLVVEWGEGERACADVHHLPPR